MDDIGRDRKLGFIQQAIGLTRSVFASFLGFVLLCSVSISLAQTRSSQNRLSITSKGSVVATREMVVAAHPLAVDAGLKILEPWRGSDRCHGGGSDGTEFG